MEADGDTMQVVAPRYREDIEIGEPDLAEEVIREYGYDHITPTFLKAAQVTTGGLTADQHRRDKLKSAMCAQGFYEAMTLAFYADADLDALHIAPDAPERNVTALSTPPLQPDHHALPAGTQPVERGGYQSEKGQRCRPSV